VILEKEAGKTPSATDLPPPPVRTGSGRGRSPCGPAAGSKACKGTEPLRHPLVQDLAAVRHKLEGLESSANTRPLKDGTGLNGGSDAALLVLSNLATRFVGLAGENDELTKLEAEVALLIEENAALEAMPSDWHNPSLEGNGWINNWASPFVHMPATTPASPTKAAAPPRGVAATPSRADVVTVAASPSDDGRAGPTVMVKASQAPPLGAWSPPQSTAKPEQGALSPLRHNMASNMDELERLTQDLKNIFGKSGKAALAPGEAGAPRLGAA